MSRAWILTKKTFSLTLVFNALLTIACAVGIMGGFYWFYSDWRPFYPFLFNGNVFWAVIAAALLNIFPSASLGRSLKTGRFLWHHYFYGFLVLGCAIVYVAVMFSPAYLFSIFLVDNTSPAVNVGRFFLLGGLTLVLDDLPDVSERMEKSLNWLKGKASERDRIISILHIVTGVFSMYLFVAVCIAMAQTPEWVTLANLILVGTVFVTGVTSFLFVKRGVWQKISDNSQNGRQTSH